MKRTVLLPVLIIVAVFTVCLNCKKETKSDSESCTCDCSVPVITKVYGKDTIELYSAFTPNNVPFCDSIVPEYDDMGNKLSHPNLCKPNVDTVWNDSINQYFYVKGIEKFANVLSFYKIGDAKVVLEFRDYSNTSFRRAVFDGQLHDTTLYGNDKLIQVAGSYKYRLILFKDKLHQQVLDTIVGTVCLVRTSKNCKSTGCRGHQPNDPLLDGRYNK